MIIRLRYLSRVAISKLVFLGPIRVDIAQGSGTYHFQKPRLLKVLVLLEVSQLHQARFQNKWQFRRDRPVSKESSSGFLVILGQRSGWRQMNREFVSIEVSDEPHGYLNVS